jgi:hypothetical protein
MRGKAPMTTHTTVISLPIGWSSELQENCDEQADAGAYEHYQDIEEDARDIEEETMKRCSLLVQDAPWCSRGCYYSADAADDIADAIGGGDGQRPQTPPQEMADATYDPGERPQGGDDHSAAAADVARSIACRAQRRFEGRAAAGQIPPTDREHATPRCCDDEHTDEETEQGAEESKRERAA